MAGGASANSSWKCLLHAAWIRNGNVLGKVGCTDLKALCTLQEAGEGLLADVHLALVHELQQGCHVGGAGGLQDDVAGAGMAGGRGGEQLLEMLTARRQDQLVRSEGCSCNKRTNKTLNMLSNKY